MLFFHYRILTALVLETSLDSNITRDGRKNIILDFSSTELV